MDLDRLEAKQYWHGRANATTDTSHSSQEEQALTWVRGLFTFNRHKVITSHPWAAMIKRGSLMHPMISKMVEVVAKGDEDDIKQLLAENVQFQPPTYYKTWTGRDPVAAILGHVGQVFSDFRYRRIMGESSDWALEFQCKIGKLDAVGVDLITLDEDGLICRFEVVMRPHKSVGALRDAMNQRVMIDPRFLKFREALS